jgi:hypothetical protein
MEISSSTFPEIPENSRTPAAHRASPDGLAIASLVLGIVPVVPVIGSALAIVFGASSRGSAKRRGLRPHPMSAWGIGLGIAGIVITVIVIVALVAAASSTSPEQAYLNCLSNAIANGTSSLYCTPPGQ